jgi:hypothetical protein
MKDFLKKQYPWLLLACILIYNAFCYYRDPVGTWERVTTNIHNPWYWIPLCFILLIPIVTGIALLRHKRKSKLYHSMIDEWTDSVKKSFEETALLKSDEIPDDESISKYYKMYLKKFELDNEDNWTTINPISFEIWEEAAKKQKDPESLFPRVGWSFMISMTSDCFMFDPESGHSTMIRYRNYESMID